MLHWALKLAFYLLVISLSSWTFANSDQSPVSSASWLAVETRSRDPPADSGELSEH